MLGRTHNFVYVADSVIIDMEHFGGATVYVYESNAEAVISLTRLKDGAGGAVIPDLITEYFTSSGAGGVWTRNTQTAADEVTKATGAANSCAAINVPAHFLTSDGGDYNQLNVEVDGSATVAVVLWDLKVQRAPANLPAVNTA